MISCHCMTQLDIWSGGSYDMSMSIDCTTTQPTTMPTTMPTDAIIPNESIGVYIVNTEPS